MTIIIASLPTKTFIEVGLLRMQTHPQEKEDVVVLELSAIPSFSQYRNKHGSRSDRHRADQESN